MLDREKFRNNPNYWTGSSPFGVDTSGHYRATRAGVEILAAGANAVDAAIATSLALGVAKPAGSGLGGMGMMLVHLAEPGRTFIIERPCLTTVRADPKKIEKKVKKRTRQNQSIAMFSGATIHYDTIHRN